MAVSVLLSLFLLLFSSDLIWTNRGSGASVITLTRHVLQTESNELTAVLCPSSAVDVYRASRPLPDDVGRSGPVRGRSRGRSSQWRWPMTSAPLLSIFT